MNLARERSEALSRGKFLRRQRFSCPRRRGRVIRFARMRGWMPQALVGWSLLATVLAAGCGFGHRTKPLTPAEMATMKNAGPALAAELLLAPGAMPTEAEHPHPALPPNPGQTGHAATAPSTTALAGLTEWRTFARAVDMPNPEARERALKQVYDEAQTPYVRALTLRALSEDPAFQSRQAQFIRRYGFYANWFNRLFYSAGRLVQGNLQAGAQVLIDAVHDTFRPPEANEYERRAYTLLQRRQAEGGKADPAMLGKLQDKVDRAFGNADVENAEWALSQGAADTATFYARQAAVRRPDWNTAQQLLDRAEAEAATQRRAALASGQVGYPDRRPPVELVPAQQMRELLLSKTSQTLAVAQPLRQGSAQQGNLVPALLASLPPPGGADAAQYERWPTVMKQAVNAPAWERRWAGALLLSPEHNRALRLERARQHRRGQLWRFIFVGPERARERAYKTATWINQTLDALQNVGIFYVFEVLGRAGQAVVSPPVSTDAVLDAQADWLRHAPAGKAARRVAQEMADDYETQKRFEDARGVLRAVGALDAAQTARLSKAEAKYLLTLASDAGPGTQREALVAQARKLDAALTEQREKKFKKPRVAYEPLAFDVPWALLTQWAGGAPPCGLPGEAAWFDGTPGNGEITTQAVRIRAEKSTQTLEVRYMLKPATGVVRGITRQVAWTSLPAGVRRGLTAAQSQRSGAQSQIRALDRLPIPFEIGGGVGSSGVDVYPRLLPLQSRPGELDLYR
jgi:hypothetical protein